LDYARVEQYGGVILDVMMPKMSGLEVLRQLRAEGCTVPILLLTAKGELEDRIEGLDLGADDYLPKPFAMGELLARVRAMLRRRESFTPHRLQFGDLELDQQTAELRCGDKSVHLSGKEFEVMRMLMSSSARVVSKQDLLTRVWGGGTEASENSVEAYISFLRKKINHLHSTVQITTLRMLGYRLEVIL
jgi:DNA-binding response OmpR family regulator